MARTEPTLHYVFETVAHEFMLRWEEIIFPTKFQRQATARYTAIWLSLLALRLSKVSLAELLDVKRQNIDYAVQRVEEMARLDPTYAARLLRLAEACGLMIEMRPVRQSFHLEVKLG